MNISLDPAIMEALNTFAEKMGTTVEYLLTILTKQAIVGARIQIVYGGIALLIAAAFAAIGHCVYRDIKDSGDDDDGSWCASYFLGAVSLIVSISFFAAAFKGLSNPDYYALKLLFQMLGK